MYITNSKIYILVMYTIKKMLKENLKKVILDQKQEIEAGKLGIKRELLNEIKKIDYTLIISGVRRCGKSTLLRQAMSTQKEYKYINFEDQRLSGFKVNDFEKIDQIFNELNCEKGIYFFDEIQNIDEWERYVRKMQDLGKIFVITGSNASLLSRELGTKLTGRYISKELFPFSYKEFLAFTRQEASEHSFEDYLKRGGFPEYLKINKAEILQQTFKDILIRDITAKYKIRNSKALQDLATYIINNIGKETSYNKLKAYLGVGSTSSITEYISYMEDAYLFFVINKFDYSIKKQMVNNKKIYSIDNGLANANSLQFSEDKGRLLENAAFLHLRQNNEKIYYEKGMNECDFLTVNKGKITGLIQVCFELNEDNLKREMDGLAEAMEKHKIKEGTIITFNTEDSLKQEGKTILVKPAWKWMLEK